MCTFSDVSFYHTMKYALYSFQLLVTCTHVELCQSMQYVWFLKAACAVKSCHHILMLLELELLPSEFPYNAARCMVKC